MCTSHGENADGNMIEAEGTNELNGLYETDEFRLYCYKVLPCSKRTPHNWQACPFAHFGEHARRRDVRTHSYSSALCPDVKKEGGCPRGDACHMSHNLFESWLHPEQYRTQLCTAGSKCTRTVCFFAHSPSELRVTSKPPKITKAAVAAVAAAAALISRPKVPSLQIAPPVASITGSSSSSSGGSGMLVSLSAGSLGNCNNSSGTSLLLLGRDPRGSGDFMLLPAAGIGSSSSMDCRTPTGSIDSSASNNAGFFAMPQIPVSVGVTSPVGYTAVRNITNDNVTGHVTCASGFNHQISAAFELLSVQQQQQQLQVVPAAVAEACFFGTPAAAAAAAPSLLPAAAAPALTPEMMLQLQEAHIQRQQLLLLQQEQQLKQQQQLLHGLGVGIAHGASFAVAPHQQQQQQGFLIA